MKQAGIDRENTCHEAEWKFPGLIHEEEKNCEGKIPQNNAVLCFNISTNDDDFKIGKAESKFFRVLDNFGQSCKMQNNHMDQTQKSEATSSLLKRRKSTMFALAIAILVAILLFFSNTWNVTTRFAQRTSLALKQVEKTPATPNKVGYITSPNVYLRPDPSRQRRGPFLQKNYQVMVIRRQAGEGGEWVFVDYNGKNGYVFSKYVSNYPVK